MNEFLTHENIAIAVMAAGLVGMYSHMRAREKRHEERWSIFSAVMGDLGKLVDKIDSSVVVISERLDRNRENNQRDIQELRREVERNNAS